MVEATGVLRGRRRRAVDGTILEDAVATQDTITQLISAIRKVQPAAVPGAAELVPVVCTAHDYSQPGKQVTGWDDPHAKDALVSALVNDARALLNALEGRELTGPAAEAVALLALVAGQDVEPAGDSDGTDGRWRIAKKVAEDRVVSTVDPEARHARKSRNQRRDGLPVAPGIRPRDRDHHRRAADPGRRGRQRRGGRRRQLRGCREPRR